MIESLISPVKARSEAAEVPGGRTDTPSFALTGGRDRPSLAEDSSCQPVGVLPYPRFGATPAARRRGCLHSANAQTLESAHCSRHKDRRNSAVAGQALP